MAKRARGRARRQDLVRGPALNWAPGDPVELFEQLDGDIDAHIWLAAADSAAAQLMRSLVDTGNAPLPVALIEPLRNGVVQHGEGTYDIRIAIATKMGLPLAGPIGPRLAEGWTLGPHRGKWELTDSTGTVIAKCEVATWDAAGEPAWTAHAMAVGQILIAYGSRVGVRVPDGVTASRYDDLYRAAELRKSLDNRRACSALVSLPKQIGAFRFARSG